MKPRIFLLAACALTPVLLSQDNAKADPKRWEIRGRAVDEAGAAIAGAGLAVGEPGRMTTASTLETPQVRTQDDGAFTLQVTLDEKDTSRTMLLAAKGRLTARLDPRILIWRTRPTDKVLDFGTIVLPRGITMRGTVRQAGGGPIPGARVVATDALQVLSTFTWTGEASVQYTSIGISDEKGLVELPGAAPGGVRVEVEADGYYVQSLPFVTHGDPLVVELRQGGFVEGQVTDAGGKPCGAWLMLSYETYDPHREMSLWTENGRFRISLRHPHRYRVRAYYGDGGMGSLSPVLDGPAKDVEVRSPGSEHIANAKAALVVRITEAGSGKAIEKVKAAAIWEANELISDGREVDWMFERRAVEGRTPGEIRLPGPKEGEPDTGIVVIKARGFAPTTIRDVKWLSDQQPEGVGVRGQPILEVKLTREAVISGTVVDDSGRAVEGAAVLVDWDDDDESPWFANAGAGEEGRTSDRDGKFRVGDLAGGKHKLRALVLGRPLADAIEVDVAASSTVEAKLLVPRGATLSGRLVGAEPPASAHVLLWKRSERNNRFRAYDDPADKRAPLETGATFKATGLDRGDYEIALHVPHRQGRGGWLVLPVEPIRIRKNDLQRDFDVSECVPGKIRGKVTLTGVTVPPRRLAVVALEHDEDSSRPWDVQSVCEQVGADGTFELPVAAGQYRVQLLDLATMVPLHVTAVLRVKPATTVDADMAQTVAQVRVRLQPERQGEAIVASRLEVAVKHQLEGHTRIRILGDEFPDSRAGVSLSGGETEIDLLLPALPTKLRVRCNAEEVLGEEMVAEDEPLVELEIAPDSNKRQEIEIRVPPPPKSAKERR